MHLKEISFDSPEYRRCLAIREKVLRKPLGLSLSSEDVHGEESQYHFALFERTEIVGCVIYKQIQGRQVKLRQMAILPAEQGKGYGSIVVRESEEIMKGKGFSMVSLSARKEAIKFYEKLGYAVVSDPFTEQGIEHARMEKSI